MAESPKTPDGEQGRQVVDALPPEPAQDATQDQIVADIEQTREQLRRNVDSLTSKLDVKGNAKAKIDQTRETVTHKISEATQGARDTYGHALESKPVVQVRAKPAVPAGVAAAIVVVVIVAVWRARR